MQTQEEDNQHRLTPAQNIANIILMMCISACGNSVQNQQDVQSELMSIHEDSLMAFSMASFIKSPQENGIRRYENAQNQEVVFVKQNEYEDQRASAKLLKNKKQSVIAFSQTNFRYMNSNRNDTENLLPRFDTGIQFLKKEDNQDWISATEGLFPLEAVDFLNKECGFRVSWDANKNFIHEYNQQGIGLGLHFEGDNLVFEKLIPQSVGNYAKQKILVLQWQDGKYTVKEKIDFSPQTTKAQRSTKPHHQIETVDVDKDGIKEKVSFFANSSSDSANLIFTQIAIDFSNGKTFNYQDETGWQASKQQGNIEFAKIEKADKNSYWMVMKGKKRQNQQKLTVLYLTASQAEVFMDKNVDFVDIKDLNKDGTNELITTACCEPEVDRRHKHKYYRPYNVFSVHKKPFLNLKLTEKYNLDRNARYAGTECTDDIVSKYDAYQKTYMDTDFGKKRQFDPKNYHAIVIFNKIGQEQKDWNEFSHQIAQLCREKGIIVVYAQNRNAEELKVTSEEQEILTHIDLNPYLKQHKIGCLLIDATKEPRYLPPDKPQSIAEEVYSYFGIVHK